MLPPRSNFQESTLRYLESLHSCFTPEKITIIEGLALHLLRVWSDGQQVFICGNGGSAANALHMANDFHYGIGACGPAPILPGLRVEALPANPAILTCLANDKGYENIFSHQLEVKANAGDLLIYFLAAKLPNIVNTSTTASHRGKLYPVPDGGRYETCRSHHSF